MTHSLALLKKKIYFADVDVLLSSYNPHICILTGVGAATKKNITFPNYLSFSQVGTNSFGGVMILYHQSIKCKITDNDLNFILIEISLSNKPIYVGGFICSSWIVTPLPITIQTSR